MTVPFSRSSRLRIEGNLETSTRGQREFHLLARDYVLTSQARHPKDDSAHRSERTRKIGHDIGPSRLTDQGRRSVDCAVPRREVLFHPGREMSSHFPPATWEESRWSV